ncbi:hypothetical protein CF326_g6489 [Tilletia indica]|nr:hypothetical protein CF326_g6489 [Tilletia indica]
MLTFIRFLPLNSNHSSFSFLLHPHLKQPNIIDDGRLRLDFFFNDEARVQLWENTPSIWCSRIDLGIYVNQQSLGITPLPLRDGDILAFPRRRCDLKTAVRFRVELESHELSCGVDQELDAVRAIAQEMMEEDRGRPNSNSSDTVNSFTAVQQPASASTASPGANEEHTSVPGAFSYAALVASRASPTLKRRPSSTLPPTTPPSTSLATLPSPAAACSTSASPSLSISTSPSTSVLVPGSSASPPSPSYRVDFAASFKHFPGCNWHSIAVFGNGSSPYVLIIFCRKNPASHLSPPLHHIFAHAQSCVC